MAVRERTHLLTVLGEDVPKDLTTSMEKATSPGAEGKKSGKGEGTEEVEEGCKNEEMEEVNQSPDEDPSESISVESGVPATVDQDTGEDKIVKTTHETDVEQ